jgi:two-component system, OmpR family, phosphate regulon response regulator OmpR
MQQKTTILIVDDSRLMTEFLTIFFSRNHTVKACTDARVALKLIKDGLRPDVILTDLNMPEMSGIEFIESVRDILPFIPIMAVSATQASELRINWLAAGADDFLLKPFHPAEMEVRLSKLIRKKSAEERPSLATAFVSHIFGRVAAAF